MFKFIKSLFNTKCLSNSRNTGFLNAIKRERNMDLFIVRVNRALAAHKDTQKTIFKSH